MKEIFFKVTLTGNKPAFTGNYDCWKQEIKEDVGTLVNNIVNNLSFL